MYGVFKFKGVKHRTEKAVLYAYDNGVEQWFPYSTIIKPMGENQILVQENFLKKNKLPYEKVLLKDLMDKVPPLNKYLIQSGNGYFPEKLLEHQKRAFEFAKCLKSVALFMEMGTGKSKLYIDLADYHFENGSIKEVVFFAPPTTLHNFNMELLKWRKSNVSWSIFSIHNLSKDFLTDAKIREFVASIKPTTMVIIDESHRIKNIESLMSQTASMVGKKTDYKIIGTGTSAPNYALDLVGQFMFLTPEIFPQSKSGLKKLFKRNDIGVSTDVKDPFKILNDTQPYIFSLAKKDAIELPSLVLKLVNVNQTPEFKAHYTALAKDASTSFMGSTGTVMGFLQNLRKIATGRNIEDEIICENPKVQALKEVLKDMPRGKKVIIWHNFHAELDDMKGVLKDYKHDFLNGKMNEKTKIKAIKEFKEGETEILVATQAVGGVGLNFTEAEYNIYFSNSFNLIDRLQSMARSHRIGQDKQVIIYDIVLSNTIDDKIMYCLENKEDFLNELMQAMKQHGKEEVLKIVL
jgi:SNF2 family DNA or RNA helicase